MPPYTLLIIAAVSLIASGASYFFAKIKVFSLTLLLFYASNTFLSFLLLHDHHIILLYTIATLFVAFPIICLITFVLDRYCALFCIDTSFVLVIVWLLMPSLFIVNLLIYIIKIIHA